MEVEKNLFPDKLDTGELTKEEVPQTTTEDAEIDAEEGSEKKKEKKRCIPHIAINSEEKDDKQWQVGLLTGKF